MNVQHKKDRLTDPAAMAELMARSEPACECMVCHLPIGVAHGPVEWKVVLWFPGPYPYEGSSHMLLCDPCKDDWLDGEWDPPYDNFLVMQVTRV